MSALCASYTNYRYSKKIAYWQLIFIADPIIGTSLLSIHGNFLYPPLTHVRLNLPSDASALAILPLSSVLPV